MEWAHLDRLDGAGADDPGLAESAGPALAGRAGEPGPPRARAARSPPLAPPAGSAARRPAYPFSALVGQDDMKLALLAAAVDPTIGGVLALGDRGTGKSTAIRSLAALLPE